jgi:hypothetical protein
MFDMTSKPLAVRAIDGANLDVGSSVANPLSTVRPTWRLQPVQVLAGGSEVAGTR